MALKDRRREVRLSGNDEDLIVEAAGISGLSVTEFLLDRALPDAEQIVRNHRTIELNEAAYAKFLEALDEPPARPAQLLDQASKARRIGHAG